MMNLKGGSGNIYEDSNPTAGSLFEYYQNLQATRVHPNINTYPDLKKKVNERIPIVVRLRYYKNVRKKFMEHYEKHIKDGYMEINKQLPDYSTINRKDAISAITIFSPIGAKSQNAYNLLENGLHQLSPSIIKEEWL